MVENAMSKAATVMGRVVQRMQQTLSNQVSPPVQVLTPKQQLERFMRMSTDDLRALEQKHGSESFSRYLVRMRQLAQEVD